MGIERSVVILKMKQALAEGWSGSAFIREMQAVGLGYRRQDMLSDWRSVGEIEKKEGTIRYVRRDYFPTEKTIAQVEWELSEEYMYKVKVHTQLRRGEPISERFVNLMSNTPLTPAEVEEQVEAKWGEWERYSAEKIKDLQTWTAYKRAM